MSIGPFNDPREYTVFWARKTDERARRLRSLVELNAPPIVISSARRLVMEAAMRIAVDAGALMADDNIKSELEREESDHLVKTGFYDDAAGSEPQKDQQ